MVCRRGAQLDSERVAVATIVRLSDEVLTLYQLANFAALGTNVVYTVKADHYRKASMDTTDARYRGRVVMISIRPRPLGLGRAWILQTVRIAPVHTSDRLGVASMCIVTTSMTCSIASEMH